MRWFSRISLVASCTALLVAGMGCQEEDKEEDKKEEVKQVKAAWIYSTTISDYWTASHNAGRLAVEANVPNVQTAYRESVATENFASVVSDLVGQGYQLFFICNGPWGDATKAAADAHPGVFFEHAAGKLTSTNMTNYFGRIYQARYLNGMIAARMSTSKKLGYVGAFSNNAQVLRGLNAFTLGARSVDPTIQVFARWTKSFNNPDKERAAALALIDTHGADVLAQHQNGPATVIAAADRGKYAFGYHGDMMPEAPTMVLTSAVWKWSGYYKSRVEAVRNGTWNNTPTWAGFESDIIDLGTMNSVVSGSVRAEVDAKRAQMAAGTFNIFTGPINRADGSAWVQAGTTLTDAELTAMADLVEGVVDTGDQP